MESPEPIRFSPFLAAPALLGSLSGALILLVAGLNFTNVAACAVLAAAGGLIGGWLARRAAIEVKLAANSGGQAGYNNLAEVYLQVIPIWTRQIETARAETERSVSALVDVFGGMVKTLEATVKASAKAAAQLDGQGDSGIIAAINHSRTELATVVGSLNAAQTSRDRMVAETKYTEELKVMVEDVQQIALQMKLLTLNGAIEAARAGEAGQGFGVLANEMRRLSGMASDLATNMAKKVDIITTVFSTISRESRDASGRDASSINQAEAAIHNVLTGFQDVTTRLSDSAQNMQRESSGIRNEISDALVSLQFQDRVNQILTHVAESMDSLSREIGALRAAAEVGDKLDTDAWLARMEQRFTMEEEIRNLRGGNLAVTRTQAIEFL